jgi:hypothetical protein
VTNVQGFRDLGTVEYMEEVAVEQGAVMWRSDTEGYKREENVKRSSAWVDPSRQIDMQDQEDIPF